jgi:hypothetical protein
MDIKELRKTEAYKELRAYVDKHVPEANRPYQLGQLAKRFLARFNEDDGQYFAGHRHHDRVLNIQVAFGWAETPEGHDWWWFIRDCKQVDLNPCPINGVKKAPKAAPRKRVGWWV